MSAAASCARSFSLMPSIAISPNGSRSGGSGSRRVPGLRREEVAALAGVSADYLRRVEQGSVIPSGTTLDALAEGLRLKRLAAVPSPA